MRNINFSVKYRKVKYVRFHYAGELISDFSAGGSMTLTGGSMTLTAGGSMTLTGVTSVDVRFP